MKENFDHSLFVERTKQIIQQYLPQENDLGEKYYDVTLCVNCLCGLIMMPMKENYKKLSDRVEKRDAKAFLHSRGILDTEVSVHGYMRGSGEMNITLSLVEMVSAIRNGLSHWRDTGIGNNNGESIVFHKNDQGVIEHMKITGLIGKYSKVIEVTIGMNGCKPILSLIDVIFG